MSATPHAHFPRLFTPYSLKNVHLRNRMVVSAHHAEWWVDKGLPSEEFVAYIEERAKGGIGLFVIGGTSPSPKPGWMENIDDSIIPRYRSCVDAAHRHGTALFAQLCHEGYFPLAGFDLGPPSAPPPRPMMRPRGRYDPTIAELKQIVEEFGAGAARALEAGVDGVELHSHELFLHAQLLNPLWNTRTDEYGGSLENRMRFMIETLVAMRKAVGDDMVLGVRLKLDDMRQRGMDLDEYADAVTRLESFGLVDYINFTCGDGPLHHGAMPRNEGEWLPQLKQMRSKTNLCLMHAGHISTPEMAENALAENLTDLVVMTKSHIADPHFTLKVYENRLDDIRYCTRCLQSCHGTADRMTCVYNPLTSREMAWAALEPAAIKKRVVIVGGGPAGMEAALTASQRGHEVIVREREPRVGGQIWIGAASSLRKTWARIGEFYERQAKKGLFEIRTEAAASADDVLGCNPDAVILATGSRPNRLALGAHQVWTVHEALAGAADNCRRVVIYDSEGFNRALVAADYLSSRGIRVYFVSPLLAIAPLVAGHIRTEMYQQLAPRGVEFLPGYDISLSSTPALTCLRSVQTAEELALADVDAVIGLVGSTSVSELEPELRGVARELYVIGDANSPQTVEAATYQGARVGRLL